VIMAQEFENWKDGKPVDEEITGDGSLDDWKDGRPIVNLAAAGGGGSSGGRKNLGLKMGLKSSGAAAGFLF